MAEIKICCSEIIGKMKPMHAVNNGPANGDGSARGNFETFSELEIPFVRNHDASLSEAYGSQHVVDVHCIFPDFTREPDDETAYDFAITDFYTKNIISAGSKVFYRLGSSIEHWVNKYGTIIPPSFEKWARICEHIIMHYNEGWADGFNYGIEYWEIWNEPDLDDDYAENKRTWSGTKAQFFDLYEIASKHLKKRFPRLKIGGPALAWREDWAEDFLGEMKKRNVEIDFFSYHIYCTTPNAITEKAERIRAMLDNTGYPSAETVLNEWNYVKDWSDPLGYIEVIKGMKGAAFCMAVMCAAQNNGKVDMLMYYDARIEKVWNGMFDSNTLAPLKGYYPFKIFSELYKLENQTFSSSDDSDIYVLSAACGDKCAAAVVYYTDEAAEDKEVWIDTDRAMTYSVLDEENTLEGEAMLCAGINKITMKPNTVIRLISK